MCLGPKHKLFDVDGKCGRWGSKEHCTSSLLHQRLSTYRFSNPTTLTVAQDTMASQLLASDPLSELSKSPSPPPTSNEAGSDDSLPRIRPRRRHRPHRKHRTVAQKIEDIYKELQDTRLDIWDLLWGLYERDLLRVSLGRSSWMRFIDRLHGEDTKLLERLIHSPGTGTSHLSAKPDRQIEALDRLDWGRHILRQEALSVACLPSFKEWLHNSDSLRRRSALYRLRGKGLNRPADPLNIPTISRPEQLFTFLERRPK